MKINTRKSKKEGLITEPSNFGCKKIQTFVNMTFPFQNFIKTLKGNIVVNYGRFF